MQWLAFISVHANLRKEQNSQCVCVCVRSVSMYSIFLAHSGKFRTSPDGFSVGWSESANGILPLRRPLAKLSTCPASNLGLTSRQLGQTSIPPQPWEEEERWLEPSELKTQQCFAAVDACNRWRECSWMQISWSLFQTQPRAAVICFPAPFYFPSGSFTTECDSSQIQSVFGNRRDHVRLERLDVLDW